MSSFIGLFGRSLFKVHRSHFMYIGLVSNIDIARLQCIHSRYHCSLAVSILLTLLIHSLTYLLSVCVRE